MKRVWNSLLVAALALAAQTIVAAPPTAIIEYLPGVVVTSGSFTNAGDTGLAASNVYLCVPATAITNSEFLVGVVTNDVRPFLSSIVEAVRAAIAGMPTTNRFASYLLDRSVDYNSGVTKRTRTYTLTEEQTIDITPSYQAE